LFIAHFSVPQVSGDSGFIGIQRIELLTRLISLSETYCSEEDKNTAIYWLSELSSFQYEWMEETGIS
jgi:hypothetical protein